VGAKLQNLHEYSEGNEYFCNNGLKIGAELLADSNFYTIFAIV
jgi:hypothetical protein